ncbi:alpha/beta hydrolase [Companilactobacillus hulinensis]|uniref:alpha/beta hydrolase n=1 Tax=Companilactobacillus hulinensis TaxID=2486007 RepID=UPI000F78D4CB|nr:alpha/beta hydrolase [Companilactobacillus hulinensis]
MEKEINVPITRDGLWLDSDITYAQVPGWLGNSTRDMKLSIIRHFQTNDETTYPVIFWFGGGGWMDVDHNIHLPNLVDFARAGYVIVSVSYRDSNKVNFPGQLEDAKAAIRYIRKNAKKFQINPNKVITMGESAGGHMASMLGVTNSQSKFDVGDNLEFSSDVNIAIPWYGVVDPLSAKQGSVSNDFDFVYRNLLGAEPEVAPKLDAQANPLTYINDKTVPFLILHGDKDEVVPIEDGKKLYNTLIDNNIKADFYQLTGAGHMDLKYWQPEIVEIILNFLKENL